MHPYSLLLKFSFYVMGAGSAQVVCSTRKRKKIGDSEEVHLRLVKVPFSKTWMLEYYMVVSLWRLETDVVRVPFRRFLFWVMGVLIPKHLSVNRMAEVGCLIPWCEFILSPTDKQRNAEEAQGCIFVSNCHGFYSIARIFHLQTKKCRGGGRGVYL